MIPLADFPPFTTSSTLFLLFHTRNFSREAEISYSLLAYAIQRGDVIVATCKIAICMLQRPIFPIV
jgi:hypothetical protein